MPRFSCHSDGFRAAARAGLGNVRRLARTVTRPEAIKGGLLGSMETLVRTVVVPVVLLFTLHCAHPHASVRRTPVVASLSSTGDAFSETGEASWYGGGGDGFSGRATASGEVFDPAELTCAHKTLPFGTLVEVENLDNGRKAVLRVNDRGPFVRGRIVDVSRQAAKDLGILGPGLARVRIQTVDRNGLPAPLESTAVRNPYTIQVAALSDAENVKRLAKELEGVLGAVTFQAAIARNGRPVTRVRAGSYENYETALKAAEKVAILFKDRGVEPFITREH